MRRLDQSLKIYLIMQALRVNRQVVLFILLLLLLSCKKDNNKLDNQVLIPLQTGNTWIYNSEGMSLNVEVQEYVNINGYEGFLKISIMSAHGYLYAPKFIVNNDSEGNYWLIGACSRTDSLLSPSIMYKIHAVKGESWDFGNIYENDSGVFYKSTYRMYCINTDTVITVPKGTFHCKVYEYVPTTTLKYRTYISVNIGIIKNETYSNNSIVSYELENYKIY